MNQEFLDRLEQWNEEDKYQEIIDAIEALPEGELDFNLTSALARAYNNLAIDVMPPEDRPLYQRALDLLLPLEDRLEEAAKQDPDVAHTWNFRVAYAYYYLNQESQALPHFEKALEARPGDEDTLEFIDRCQQCLALPLYMRPFRGRTEEGWSSFLAGEGELRALMDQEDREAGGFYRAGQDGEVLIARQKEVFDAAMPSGNAAAALALVGLARLTGESRFRALAGRQLNWLAGQAGDYPSEQCFALLAMAEALYPGLELVCVSAGEVPDWLAGVGEAYHLTALAKTADKARGLARVAPYTADYPIPAEGIRLYLCREGACQAPADTLEGQLVRFADKIAYINHDIDDAMRGGIIFPTDIPAHISQVLGYTHGERIETLSMDVIRASAKGSLVRQTPEVAQAMAELKEFMFQSVYFNPLAKGEEGKAEDMICLLYEYYYKHTDKLPSEYQDILMREGRQRAVLDYIAGMTDTYAVEQFKNLFIPRGWVVK